MSTEHRKGSGVAQKCEARSNRVFLDSPPVLSMISSILYEAIFEFIQRVDFLVSCSSVLPKDMHVCVIAHSTNTLLSTHTHRATS